MARPIEETPVLEGKDAKKFEQNLKDASKKRIDEKSLSRILENHKKLQSLYLTAK